MADSTKAMRKSIVDRDILPAFENRQLNEIASDDLRALCNKVKERGAPATAVHIRDIVKCAAPDYEQTHLEVSLRIEFLYLESVV